MLTETLTGEVAPTSTLIEALTLVRYLPKNMDADGTTDRKADVVSERHIVRDKLKQYKNNSLASLPKLNDVYKIPKCILWNFSTLTINFSRDPGSTQHKFWIGF